MGSYSDVQGILQRTSSSVEVVEEESASFPSPEAVVALRAGEVLIKHTILKSDHFPGCQNTRLLPLVDGAPNFRQVPELPVYGVAIPTVSGLRNVLNLIGAARGHRKVLWINLREEPILFINGRPFVVREADKPFANLEYTGINRENVEDMEIRLKTDVLTESETYGGSIMVAHEDDQFQVIEDWEGISLADVQTPLEVYAELIEDGYDIEYLRVPITDEKAPKGDDFEALINRCWSPPKDSAIVFNCQMGRGRTTTGMVIGCLLHLRRNREKLTPLPDFPESGLPSWFVERNQIQSPEEFKTGMFPVIRSLLRALELGKVSKAALDSVLDACSSMQHLREAIASYRKRLLLETNDTRRQSLMQACLEYLERYFVLIAFAAYLEDPAFKPASENHVTFACWWSARPELQGILMRMLRSNPVNALVLDQSLAQSGAEISPTAKAVRTSLDKGFDEHNDLLGRREGSVLGPHTILKQDHFSGCQSPHLPVLVQGAPNFRGVGGDDIRVFGSGIPTCEGIREILKHVGAAPVAEGSQADNNVGQISAVWHIMREEPVVFICGEPYVLREEFRPFKNLLEYRGIDSERLDQMEKRLKDDIIEEASRGQGRVLVTKESVGKEDGVHTLKQEFQCIQRPEQVETPSQIFEKLQQEGYSVNLVRVPITDGTCPDADDFDAFYSAAAAAGPRDALIYTCQLGGGRTTTGMAIGTLLRMHLNGASLQTPSEMDRQATLERLDEDLGGKSPKGGSDDEEDYDFPEKNAEDVNAREEKGFTTGADNILSNAVSKLLDLSDSDARKTFEHNSQQDVNTVHDFKKHSLKPLETPLGISSETRNLQDGEYVGVRRFTRTLERGSQAKAEVDEVVDACGALINLRTAIMRYRKPPKTNKFYRPEIQARHVAFQRGSAYLERYCMLIAFAAYLRQCRQRGRQTTFGDWLLARPDVTAAREAIHQNPAGALAPVPAMLPLSPTPGKHLHRHGEVRNYKLEQDIDSSISPFVPASEQRKVLLHRRGSTVGRRSILKTFTPSQKAQAYSSFSCFSIPGVTDVRASISAPVYTLGNSTVDGLRGLIAALGASAGGESHVVITDLREELVLYVNGVAYLRRELEMPSAALHHAGIQPAKLEDLERRLRADMLSESTSWGGKLLLHREVESPHVSNVSNSGPKILDETSSVGREDIARSTYDHHTTQLVGFWESTGDIGDIDMGLCTPQEVFVGLAAEGYQISYRRVPMSRERTPQALDLDQLYLQMGNHPGGKQIAWLFVGRTATGSSARFAAAFATSVFSASNSLPSRPGSASALTSPRAGITIMRENSQSYGEKITSLASPVSKYHTFSSGSSPPIAENFNGGNPLLRVDSELSDLMRSVEAGEYRGIMNLCRVLPGGAEAKTSVDKCIDACDTIGNLRDDILRCKHIADGDIEIDDTAAAAARRLGLHYLQRYFFLIAFRVYLETVHTSAGVRKVVFSDWIATRKEIGHLLSTLDLE